MLIKRKGVFLRGLVMSVVFAAVLILMFLPLFRGDDAFRAADKLFNSISKGSTYYIPMLKEKLPEFRKGTVSGLTLLPSAARPEDVVAVLKAAGADASMVSGRLKLSSDLGKLFDAALLNADDMFFNRGEAVKKRVGFEERRVLFAWWHALKATAKILESKERFKESAFVGEVMSRGVEVGYNYYTIEPVQAIDRWPTLTLSLVFYVVYTLWWGFAIYFMFEGIGLQLKAGKKKEV
jgi:hypothetical protein